MTLRELRALNKKSVAEVANALGVTERAIYNYEQGIRSINLEQVLILAKLFDISEKAVIEAQLNSITIRTPKKIIG